jgi:hypothetical protein
LGTRELKTFWGFGHEFCISSAAYFTGVAFVAAIIGQHCVRKLIAWLGRASLIVFILASMIFLSALTLGRDFGTVFTLPDCKLNKNSQEAGEQLFFFAENHASSLVIAGGVGISNIVHRMERHQYMGFESLCKV